MKAKTIKRVIRSKIKDWVGSIEDADLRALLADQVTVTGGCITSMLLRERVNDFDVYLKTPELALELAKYYVKRFKPKLRTGVEARIWAEHRDGRVQIVIKSAGVASEEGTERPYEYFEARDGSGEDYAEDVVGPEDVDAEDMETLQDPGEIADAEEELRSMASRPAGPDEPRYRPVFMSTNAITLSDGVQVVLRFTGEPEDVHANYDFVHCTCHYTSWDDELVLPAAALEAILTKELRYVGSKYPICSLIRMRKFIRRGWSVNAGQVLKMVMQASQLNLKDFKVLQDQLTGVDVAYFAELLAKVHDQDPQKVNSAYLIEIIDRLF